jgi:hypothetical protein
MLKLQLGKEATDSIKSESSKLMELGQLLKALLDIEQSGYRLSLSVKRTASSDKLTEVYCFEKEESIQLLASIAERCSQDLNFKKLFKDDEEDGGMGESDSLPNSEEER